MAKAERIFVVVDPSSNQHPALDRVIRTAVLRPEMPVVKVFIAVDSESTDTRAVNDNLFRHESWFGEEIRGPLEKAGIEYSLEISWSGEWQKSIVQASKAFGTDRIYLPVHERSESTSRFSFSESQWDLLKTAECPVVLIQPGAKEDRKVVLAAVNFQALSDEQRALNKSILHWGKEVAEMYKAEFHVVNAYLDSMNYPDRGRLANETGLSSDRIHVEAGYTDESVSAVADRINADLVVMGSLGQNGLTGSRRRGNTAARVIAALKQDIMVVNH
ncbi:universal stress protein [Agaribacterium haliotis]|uniref:universal stress protein n=1 Tax=Agaribacterium haliotis TaxID=2013869 RepID=UPI000BB54517|nr:universal stress protein [Agaribacterium haliotis]